MTGSFEVGVRQVMTEAAGVLSLTVIQPISFPTLFLGARQGNVFAQRVLRCAESTLAGIEQASETDQKLCACCPRNLRSAKFSICLAVPERDDPTMALGFAICTKCAVKPKQVSRLAFLALRKIWPDMREIAAPITGQVGHA